MSADPKITDKLDLKEYETKALTTLIQTGRTTAPNLAEATNIPKARIYGVLESLANQGYIKMIPGRPKQYQPKPPKKILETAKENKRQEFETYKGDIERYSDEFLETYQPLFQKSNQEITPTEELFHVVEVGKPSEKETRRLYKNAEKEINVLTKSLDYLPNVETAFQKATQKNIDIKLLFLHPKHLSENNIETQKERIARIKDEYPEVGLRFSNKRLPWRGTFIDPSLDYETGEAVVLVEEKDVPLNMQQAAVTENPSFVAGLKRYFDLIWKHDSKSKPYKE